MEEGTREDFEEEEISKEGGTVIRGGVFVEGTNKLEELKGLGYCTVVEG